MSSDGARERPARPRVALTIALSFGAVIVRPLPPPKASREWHRSARSVARVHRMPPKKSAAKNKKPAKFVFEFADLALIGQPVRKEFEGVPPTPQPAAAHCSRARHVARQGMASSRGG